MPYKKQTMKKSKAIISENLRNYFLTGERAKGDLDLLLLIADKNRLKTVWKAVEKDILAGWIQQYPCSRPFFWWQYNSEPRQRLGGVGTPSYEVLSVVPHFNYGIPEGWVNQFQADYYNGRARDIHGNLIKNEYHEGHFQGVAISEEDPPTYEGQSVYLERHGLLTEAEKQWLEKHVEAKEPEAVTDD